MIRPKQIHCWMDSYSHLIEQKSTYDSRPVYIGVWNAAFDSNENGLAYFSSKDDDINWPERLERLYGGKVSRWLIYGVDKRENLCRLKEIMQERNEHLSALIIVDLYWIPFVPQYRTKHTPHVIIITGLENQKWLVEDPYFGWTGQLDDLELHDAFQFENLAMGVTIDTSRLHRPSEKELQYLMRIERMSPTGKLAAEVEKYLSILSSKSTGSLKSKEIFTALEPVGVISKRLNGYAEVINYFAEDQSLPMQNKSDQVQGLVKGWESLILSVTRLAILGNRLDFAKISMKLRELESLEADIKQVLLHTYDGWRSRLAAGRSESNL